MITRWWTAWAKRRTAQREATSLIQRLRAEPYPPPVLPRRLSPPPAAARDEPYPPWPPSAYVRHVWPPLPATLPPGHLVPSARLVPPCDPAWRAITARRPGYATYPPTRRQPGWLDDAGRDVR